MDFLLDFQFDFFWESKKLTQLHPRQLAGPMLRPRLRPVWLVLVLRMHYDKVWQDATVPLMVGNLGQSLEVLERRFRGLQYLVPKLLFLYVV